MAIGLVLSDLAIYRCVLKSNYYLEHTEYQITIKINRFLASFSLIVHFSARQICIEFLGNYGMQMSVEFCVPAI